MKCKFCCVSSEDQVYLWNHSFCHFNYNSFKCGYINCGVAFSSEHLLHYHLIFKHNGIKKAWLCLTNTEVEHYCRKKAVICVKEEKRSNNGRIPETQPTFNKPSKIMYENEVCVDTKLKRKWPNQKSDWLKCTLCNAVVGKLDEKRHCRKHLKEEGGVGWLHCCLLCPKENPMRTMHVTCIRNHLQRVHQLNKPRNGQHYTDRPLEFKHLINNVVQKCFKNATPSSSNKNNCGNISLSSQKLSTKYNNGNSSFAGVNNKRRKFSISNGTIPVKCSVCSLMMKMRYQKSHCLKHLKKVGGVDWLHRCLLCSEENQMTTMYKNHIRSHLQNIHNIRNPKQGEHYYDRTSTYENIIKTVEERCFKNTLKFGQGKTDNDYQVIENQQLKCTKLKKRRRKASNQKGIPSKCAICFKLVHPYFTRCHCRKHLKKEGGVTWLYRCLLCSKRKPLTTMYIESVCHHIRIIHKIADPQTGRHYVDRSSEYQDIINQVKEKCFKNKMPLEQKEFVKEQVLDSKEIRCRKCGVVVNNELHKKQMHILMHLRKEGRVKWCYTCLLCPKGQKFSSMMHMKFVTQHMESQHSVFNPQAGLHYLDCTQEISKMIKDSTYFQTNFAVQTTSSWSVHVPYYAKCSLCRKDIKNETWLKKQHCLKHLPEEDTEIKFVYSCLLCYGMKQEPVEFQWRSDVTSHLRKYHNVSFSKPNVNFKDRSSEVSEVIAILMEKCFKYLISHT